MQIQTTVSGISRDINTTALLSTNVDEFLAYKSRREKDKKIEDVMSDVESLKSDITEIKRCLQELLVGK